MFRLEEIADHNIPGVTTIQVWQHIEACKVCLDIHQHKPPIEFSIKQVATNLIELDWEQSVDEQVRRSWRDLQEATEYGATAIAILYILEFSEYTIIERSVKNMGFDYWLLEDNLFDADDIFPKGTARLEVSGIMKAEKESTIQARIREKIKQTDVSDDEGFPAIIIVVEFSRPDIHVVRKS